MGLRQHRKTTLALFLLLVSAVLASFQTQHVDALIPSIVSINYGKSGTHTILNITVNHTPPPTISSGHYVSIVEVDINGTIHDLNQTAPQSTETFTVQYDMGEVSVPLPVRARAYCIIHLWGDWSATITVPEYSLFSLALILILVTSIVLVIKLLHEPSRKENGIEPHSFLT